MLWILRLLRTPTAPNETPFVGCIVPRFTTPFTQLIELKVKLPSSIPSGVLLQLTRVPTASILVTIQGTATIMAAAYCPPGRRFDLENITELFIHLVSSFDYALRPHSYHSVTNAAEIILHSTCAKYLGIYVNYRRNYKTHVRIKRKKLNLRYCKIYEVNLQYINFKKTLQFVKINYSKCLDGRYSTVSD